MPQIDLSALAAKAKEAEEAPNPMEQINTIAAAFPLSAINDAGEMDEAAGNRLRQHNNALRMRGRSGLGDGDLFEGTYTVRSTRAYLMERLTTADTAAIEICPVTLEPLSGSRFYDTVQALMEADNGRQTALMVVLYLHVLNKSMGGNDMDIEDRLDQFAQNGPNTALRRAWDRASAGQREEAERLLKEGRTQASAPVATSRPVDGGPAAAPQVVAVFAKGGAKGSDHEQYLAVTGTFKAAQFTVAQLRIFAQQHCPNVVESLPQGAMDAEYFRHQFCTGCIRRGSHYLPAWWDAIAAQRPHLIDLIVAKAEVCGIVPKRHADDTSEREAVGRRLMKEYLYNRLSLDHVQALAAEEGVPQNVILASKMRYGSELQSQRGDLAIELVNHLNKKGELKKGRIYDRLLTDYRYKRHSNAVALAAVAAHFGVNI